MYSATVISGAPVPVSASVSCLRRSLTSRRSRNHQPIGSIRANSHHWIAYGRCTPWPTTARSSLVWASAVGPGIASAESAALICGVLETNSM